MSYTAIIVTLRSARLNLKVEVKHTDAAGALELIGHLNDSEDGTIDGRPLRDSWQAVAESDGQRVTIEQLREWEREDTIAGTL